MSDISFLNGSDAFFIFVPEHLVHVLTSFTVITSLKHAVEKTENII